MSLQHWLAYLSLVLVVIASPGPSAMLCTTHGATHGKHKTLATVLGGMLASMVLMSLSAMGLGAIIAASELLFQAIKFSGAVYLIVLGISVWRSSVPTAETGTDVEINRLDRSRIRQLCKQGFVVGIANPKDLLFFGALFPQFLDLSSPMLPQVVTLAGTWLVVDGTVMFCYATLGVKAGPTLGRLGLGKMLNRITGGAFIAAGTILASTNK